MDINGVCIKAARRGERQCELPEAGGKIDVDVTLRSIFLNTLFWFRILLVNSVSFHQSSTGPAVDTPFAVQVYSLARGSWKTLIPSPPTVSVRGSDLLHITVHRKSVFNGAVHWFPCRNLNYKELGIVSFDMATESFSQIELPKPLRKTTDSLVLSVHEDSLALIKIFQRRYSRSRVITHCYLKLWVMQQYGAVKSWTESYSVTLSKPVSSVYHVGFISNGEQVFKSTKDIRLVMVDFKTKQVRYSGVGEGRNYESMDSFVESLLLLDQSNACSYQVAGTSKPTSLVDCSWHFLFTC
ncbi:F-box/kelch-repeat protein [Pyrus ussuriensis x Pyrus communis]|uniref:F-box/kelch-repeat protein n=1 Tax=Pyrus ussuriensis x Pyrus communis TaxID=2448454 RepID=A0A5N5HPB8_9ROSA|nr:F-box/kelch-repeat protein [Pyrus ussuriensis x Pyrus communis]